MSREAGLYKHIISGPESIPKYFLIVCFLMIFFKVYPQIPETIVSDRPGQAYSPNTAGKGIFQVQAGYDHQWFKNRKNDLKGTAGLTGVFLKFGLTERLSLNALAEYNKMDRQIMDSSEILKGFQNMMAGLRINLLTETGSKPSIGTMVMFRTPNSSGDFTQDQLSAKILFMLTNNFSKKLNLNVNLGIDFDGNSIIPLYQYVCNMGINLNNSWSVFIENYGMLKNKDFQNRWDAGVAYLVNPDMQFDLYGGKGINKSDQDGFISIGVSYRVKN
ncbi:MAG: transporter [Flavobacteriales bacterium]|nr:transporter [Flavobacteriales bacterium]